MFTDWFNQKYQDWRGDRWGQDVSVAAFARYIGLKQQLVDGYLRGTIPRDKRIINRIADKFGSEVYEEIGLNLTPIQKLVFDMNLLPKEAHPELIKYIRELRAKYNARTILHRDISDDPNE